jgi:RNA polymerase sigma-70 factor, ECF subfamily
LSGLSLEEIEAHYERYGSAVLHRCRQLLRNEAGAWDAMHQTFVRAIRYRETFRGDTSLLGWLYSIALRVCMDEIRIRRRDEVPPELVAAIESEGGSLAERLERQEIIALLLSSFSDEIQQIVVLRYFDELEVRQIAERTGLSERTVARRLNQFLVRSRRLLEAA